MYEDKYKLTKLEMADYERCQEIIATYGGLYKFDRASGQPVVDGANNPIPSHFERLAGSPTFRTRFIMDSQGVVWPFMARGASKCPHLPDGGGSKALSDYVEMATGRWRKIKDPNNPGKMTYAKNTVWINMESQVQGHPNESKIEYMKNRKGFGHPMAEPHYPPVNELASLESKQRANAPVILAQVRNELANSGLEKADEYIKEAEARAADVTTPVALLPEQTLRPDPIVMASPPAPAPEPTPAPPTQTTSETLSPAPVEPTPVPETPPATNAQPATVDTRATQDAIKFAAANNIDLATVKGTGMNGRIRIGDVKALVPATTGRTNKA